MHVYNVTTYRPDKRGGFDTPSVKPAYRQKRAERPAPSVDAMQELVDAGLAWRKSSWHSRYAAALIAAGKLETA